MSNHVVSLPIATVAMWRRKKIIRDTSWQTPEVQP